VLRFALIWVATTTLLSSLAFASFKMGMSGSASSCQVNEASMECGGLPPLCYAPACRGAAHAPPLQKISNPPVGAGLRPARVAHTATPIHSPRPRSISSLVVGLSLCSRAPSTAPPIRSSGPLRPTSAGIDPRSLYPLRNHHHHRSRRENSVARDSKGPQRYFA
jgi:hypothetical protein